jgi:hypothetical protein
MAVVPQPDRVESDLRIIVGGNFTRHALGGEFTRILDRLRGAPDAYLDAFERMFITPALDAHTLSRLHLDGFLDRMRPTSPARVQALADRLLRQYDAALSIADHAAGQEVSLVEALPPGETSRFVQRLDNRRRTLRVLLQRPDQRRG